MYTGCKMVSFTLWILPFDIFSTYGGRIFTSVFWYRCTRQQPKWKVFKICVFALLGAGGIGCFIWSLISCSRYIVLENDRLLCKALFRKTIVLEYSKCNVGIDYSYNSSTVFWWIYFCIGPLPKYNPKIPVNRVNAIKYSDSFVRIMYSDEVYSALLEVLPKKQRTALTCAYNIHIRE